MIDEIIFFEKSNFQGNHIQVFKGFENFYNSFDFKEAHSFVVKSGQWIVYDEVWGEGKAEYNFYVDPTGQVWNEPEKCQKALVGPGIYPHMKLVFTKPESVKAVMKFNYRFKGEILAP
ncbi:MAG: beta/gamma crystallin-related protein [Promethearchaeota archaeon]